MMSFEEYLREHAKNSEEAFLDEAFFDRWFGGNKGQQQQPQQQPQPQNQPNAADRLSKLSQHAKMTRGVPQPPPTGRATPQQEVKALLDFITSHWSDVRGPIKSAEALASLQQAAMRPSQGLDNLEMSLMNRGAATRDHIAMIKKFFASPAPLQQKLAQLQNDTEALYRAGAEEWGSGSGHRNTMGY